MKFYQTGNVYFLRLEIGEEVLAALTEFCKAQDIRLGQVNAIGAVSHAVTGLYNVAEQKYYSTRIEGPLEIVSLMGSISRKDGEVYIHTHASFSDLACSVRGGHLTEAVVSATCEMVVTAYEGEVGRRVCEKTGLNIFDL